MLARAGFENVEKDNAYNGMTLREWARMSLTERGIGWPVITHADGRAGADAQHL